MSTPGIPPSTFLPDLLAHNRALGESFRQWRFLPGMLFGDLEQWWDFRPRPHPHEGLDLCSFIDHRGALHYLPEQTAIPAPLAGRVVHLARDFLGISIYLRHEETGPRGRRLYTIFGHTAPLATLRPGLMVKAGEPLACLAGLRRRHNGLRPHLHLTLAWVPPDLPPQELTWETLGQNPAVTLIDPLTALALLVEPSTPTPFPNRR
mgnify:CR=1 FL=1